MTIKLMVIAMTGLVLSGCVRYGYKTTDCELVIWSMREINAANLVIGKDCELSGGAAGMKYNEMQYQVMQKLVDKIP